MPINPDDNELWALCDPVVRGAGYELVELEFRREQGGWVLRLYIDRPPVLPSPRITVDDCAVVSRDVSAALDAADRLHVRYALEVSSPGLERPLRREQDFARFVGRRARIRLRVPVEGRKNFAGTLKAVADGRVTLTCEGQDHSLVLADVAKANLVPDLESELPKGN